MTIAGATSPVTLAGTVVQGLAEFLGIATALQVAAPGAQLVFCFGSGILDMLRTTFSLGCVESALMAAMATEVGHYLGVPTLNPGLSTDGKHPGPQTGYEKALKARASAARTPTSSRAGASSTPTTPCTLPQSVIDNEIAAMVRRLRSPVEISAGHAGRRSPSPRPDREAASWARRTRRVASAPASIFCPRSPTASPTRSGSRRARLSTTWRTSRSSVLLAAHAAKPPYLGDDQLGELAAICRVDDDVAAGRAASSRRGPVERRTHDDEDRLHRARQPGPAPGRQPAARRLPASPCTTWTRAARSTSARRAPPARTRSRRQLAHRTRSSPACRRLRSSPTWSPGRAASSRPRPRRHLDRHEHQRLCTSCSAWRRSPPKRASPPSRRR